MRKRNDWYGNDRWREQIRRNTEVKGRTNKELRRRYPHLSSLLDCEFRLQVNKERGPLPKGPNNEGERNESNE
jgi:hypothetical protein